MGQRDLMSRLREAEDRLAALERAGENPPARFGSGGAGGGSGILLKFGKLKAEWASGGATVTLTPSSEDGTPVEGAADVTVRVYAGNVVPSSFGAKVGQVLGYVTQDGVHYLFNHNQMPISERQYHTIQNTAADGQPAQWRAQFIRGF